MFENLFYIRWKKLGILTGLSLSLVVAGCGQDGSASNGNNGGNETTTNVSEELDYPIIGVEPGAGLTGLSKNTLEEYENLKGWELVESSTPGMLSSLEQAIRKKNPLLLRLDTSLEIFRI